jgi:DNA-binding Lrp family transcriptional regulator
MSASIIANIFQRVQTSQAESIILQAIAYRANIQGQNARISYEALAQATEFSERWCKELVKRLEEKHLLRVHRQWIAPSKCAINKYDVVRPWLRELNYREVFSKKKSTEQISSELPVHPEPTKEKTKRLTGFCSKEECIAAGLTEGSEAYKAAMGLPVEEEMDG